MFERNILIREINNIGLKVEREISEKDIPLLTDRYQSLLNTQYATSRDPNILTDKVFHALHPELGGRGLLRTDPVALKNEWKTIYRKIVIPFTRSMSRQAAGPRISPPENFIDALDLLRGNIKDSINQTIGDERFIYLDSRLSKIEKHLSKSPVDWTEIITTKVVPALLAVVLSEGGPVGVAVAEGIKIVLEESYKASQESSFTQGRSFYRAAAFLESLRDTVDQGLIDLKKAANEKKFTKGELTYITKAFTALNDNTRKIDAAFHKEFYHFPLYTSLVGAQLIETKIDWRGGYIAAKKIQNNPLFEVLRPPYEKVSDHYLSRAFFEYLGNYRYKDESLILQFIPHKNLPSDSFIRFTGIDRINTPSVFLLECRAGYVKGTGDARFEGKEAIFLKASTVRTEHPIQNNIKFWAIDWATPIGKRILDGRKAQRMVVMRNDIINYNSLIRKYETWPDIYKNNTQLLFHANPV